MSKVIKNPVAKQGLQYLNTASDFESFFYKLDQTIPQTIINGTPIFNLGLQTNGNIDLNNNYLTNGSQPGGSNFLGNEAGFEVEDATDSFFVGDAAGKNATHAAQSIFIGLQCGQNAVWAGNSIFLGYLSGANATNAMDSIFIGRSSGTTSTDSTQSIFLGSYSGYGADKASNSIFIGYGCGENDTIDNVTGGGSSICLGNFSGTGGNSNSIAIGNGVINSTIEQLNIGNVIYATGIYKENTKSSTPQANGKVGIGTNAPNSKSILDIVSTTNGVLFPRMTTAQRDAITSPPEGLLIYNLTTHVFDFYNGTVWGPI